LVTNILKRITSRFADSPAAAVPTPARYRSNKAIGAEVAGAFNPNNPVGSWHGTNNRLGWMRSYNPDDLVKSKSKGIQIYQEMTREPIVKAALQQKTTALLSVPWGVKPASTDAGDVERAKFVLWNLKNLAGGFARDVWEMCDALVVGHSIQEKVLELVEGGDWDGMIRIRSLKSKDPYYFGFAFDEFMNLLPNGVIMTTAANGESNVSLSAEKFFVFSYMKKYENLYGQSDLRAAYRAFWIKDTAWKLRSVYMERFSGNNLKGKYPRNKDAEANKNKLLEIFKSWQNETGVAIPEDLEIEVMQVATSSDSEYARAMADCNVDMAVSILGETLTLNEGRKTGARNMGEIHKEVVDLFVLFLDMILTADINEQIVRPLIDLNYSGVTEYPEFYWYPREDYDPVAFGTAIKSWKEAGAKISKAWFYERTRMPLPTGKDDELEPEKTQPVTVNPFGAQTSGQEPNREGAKVAKEGGSKEQEPKPLEKMAEQSSGYSRELSKFEKFAEIPKIDNRLKMLTDKAIAISQPAYDQIFKNILSQVEKKNVLASSDYAAAAKIAVNPAPLKDVLFRTLLTANMMGRADVVIETQNQGYNFGKIKKFAEVGFDWSLMDGPFTPEEASNFFAGKVPMTKEEYDALVQQLMDQAFYVSGLDKTAIEGDVKGLLTDALKNGMSLDTFKYKLNELQIKYTKPVYEREGVGQASADDTVLDYHAETVFRTNIMSSYNEGRSEIYNDPDVSVFFPALEYTAIMDGRTTETCSELDGMIRLADDPAWDKFWPPNHFNCRSTVVSINKYDFTQDMITEVPNVDPQEGFGS
jgi:SPP1 gp7 family putative phage head morphogenesis protein